MIRVGFLLIFLGMLAGCSPDYNWRDVAVADGAVKAAFPDTPEIRTRKLLFSGHEIDFTLTVAKVNGALFAVGYGALPEPLRSDAAARDEMGKEAIRSLYRNSGVDEPGTLPGLGTRFVVTGQSPKGPVTTQATVWAPPHALIEAIVTADSAAFPKQQADDFLRSVVVAR